MKKILIIAISVLLLATTSCKEGLEPEIYGSLSPLTFPSNAREYELYTLDLYVPFTSRWSFEEGGTKYTFFSPEEGHIQMFDAPTDIMTIFTAWGNGGVFWDAKSRGNFIPLVSQSRNRSHFEKVRLVTKATRIISDLEKATVFSDDASKNKLIAEAKMARGWIMYFLLELYGTVPVILDPAKVGDPIAESDLTRPSRQVYVSAIESDLTFAADHLPVNPEEYGRFNKGHALTVLMRLYLNEKDFQNAEATGRKIQTLGYSLVDDYTSLFREATEKNSETIFAISVDPISQGRASDGNFNAFFRYTLPSDFPENPGWAPSGVFSAPWQFYDSFHPADERRSLLIASYGTKARENMPGAVINKYPAEGSNAYQGNDIVVSRYADVLLMLAEAINENNNGPTTEAISLVNQVRTRASIGDLSAEDTSSKAAFNAAILRERSWELYFEGYRLQDLRRHGKWQSAVSAITGKQPGPDVYPIPQYAVDDGVVQNAGF
jgi:hypothetical protein